MNEYMNRTAKISNTPQRRLETLQNDIISALFIFSKL